MNDLQELLDQTQCISGIGSWKLDLVNNQIQLSKQLYRIFGWSERKAYALEDFYGSVHCDDLLRVKGTVRKVISEGGVYKHRYRFVRPDGQVRMLKSEGEGNTAVDGMVTEVVGVTQDITHQEEREKEVKMLSLIARETSDAVIVLSSEGIIQWVNKAFTEITEFTEKEIIHKRFEDFLHGPETDPETLAYKNFMVAQGRPFHCELIKYRKSGEPFWMDIQGYPLYDPKGGMIQFVQIESDITKRKQELIRLKEG
ncbi:MAG: PAS domain S-box protein, partial [Marinoscillum sp.]